MRTPAVSLGKHGPGLMFCVLTEPSLGGSWSNDGCRWLLPIGRCAGEELLSTDADAQLTSVQGNEQDENANVNIPT